MPGRTPPRTREPEAEACVDLAGRGGTRCHGERRAQRHESVCEFSPPPTPPHRHSDLHAQLLAILRRVYDAIYMNI